MLESKSPTRLPVRPAERRFGLGVALVTPFARDGSVDLVRLVAHARNCLDEGCSSVTLFGTTGEGASLGSGQRAAMLEAMDDAGLDLRATVLAGVAASAAEDASAQANQLYDAGGRGILLAPPFYFKGVGDEGLYRWFSTVLERCRDPREVIVYHLPSITAVPLSSPLIGRLKRAFPGVVTGVKDSSGDDDTAPADHPPARARRRRALLARAVRTAAAGDQRFSNCARLLAPMVDDEPRCPACRNLSTWSSHPVTPAVKALAHRHGDRATCSPRRCWFRDRDCAQAAHARSTPCSRGTEPDCAGFLMVAGAARPGVPALHPRAAGEEIRAAFVSRANSRDHGARWRHPRTGAAP
jgi:4-hydroxy-tetrahydrodipicolinate synthase